MFFSIIYTITAYYHLYTFATKIISIKNFNIKIDKSLDHIISKHSIHIRGINQNLTYLDAKNMVENFFNSNFSEYIIYIQVIPNYDILMDLIDKKFLYKSLYDKYNKLNVNNYPKREKIFSGYFWNKKEIDAEIYYNHLCVITENMLNFYRKLNIKKNTGNAFLVFKSPSIVDKILNNKNLIYNRMNTFEGTLLAIEDWIIKRAPFPSEIIWDNIKYSKKWRTIRMYSFTFILFIVCLIIITPAFINDEISPLIQDLSKQIKNQDIKTILTEYSYTLIVVVMNSGVIPFIVGYIAMFELHYKRSYREKSIFVKNVVFMVVNCFFIPTFGVLSMSKIKEGIKLLIINHWDFDISEGFIKNSYFFMRYIIQVIFISNGFQLLALPQLFVKKFRVFLAKTDYEKFYASLVKKYFDYGYNYSFSITVFMLTLVFSTTIPLIVPFGSLFFILKYYIDKYNLLFLYPAEFESHGNVTELVMKFDLIGIFFFQFIISNLLIKMFKNKNYAIVSTLLYLIISIFIYFGMKHLFIQSEKDKTENEQNIFERILNKTQLNKLLFQNKFLHENEQNIDNSYLLNRQSEGENSTYDEILYKFMKEAYVHPAEKDKTVNSYQIWNDGYTYMKTGDTLSNENYKEKKFKYYEDIIIPKSDLNRESTLK